MACCTVLTMRGLSIGLLLGKAAAVSVLYCAASSAAAAAAAVGAPWLRGRGCVLQAAQTGSRSIRECAAVQAARLPEGCRCRSAAGVTAPQQPCCVARLLGGHLLCSPCCTTRATALPAFSYLVTATSGGSCALMAIEGRSAQIPSPDISCT